MQMREKTIMTTASEEQSALWNGTAGRAWVDLQDVLDQTLRPFQDLLVDAVSGARVLDVGCGTGSTTLAAARRLGEHAHCTGVDISAPMIALAQSRARAEHSRASFLCADAQTHAFEPATYDAIISRFGVMFFADPIAAFANLHRACTSGAELRFVAWRSPDENPFMTTAERAAAPLLPSAPERAPDAPGQFAFADAARVRRILQQSGWTDVDMRPIDVTCTLPERDMVRYATRLGPVGRILLELDDATRTRVIDALRTAFEPYVHGAEVRFTAACWWVGARAQPARATGSR
jgi:ubiquinone/menaquinone biosynthesis C-methylase UbiE